jgi:hypothetical protein
MRRQMINVVFKLCQSWDTVLKNWIDAPCAPMVGDTVMLDKNLCYQVKSRILIPVSEHETTVHCFVEKTGPDGEWPPPPTRVRVGDNTGIWYIGMCKEPDCGAGDLVACEHPGRHLWVRPLNGMDAFPVREEWEQYKEHYGI